MINNLVPNEQEKLSNLQVGYNHLEKQYESKVEIITKIDEKVNMFLVFNAAIIVLLTIVFPLPNLPCLKTVLSWVVFSLFSISMILSVLFSVLAIFPRSVYSVSSGYMTDFTIYSVQSIDFLKDMMISYNKFIERLDAVLLKKSKYMRISIIFTVLNFILMIALIIYTSL